MFENFFGIIILVALAFYVGYSCIGIYKNIKRKREVKKTKSVKDKEE